MYKNIRTDLAIENREIYNQAKNAEDEIPGVKVETEQKNNIKITRVIIETKEGEEALNKPVGRYITLDIPNIYEMTAEDEYLISENISKELKLLFDKKPESVLVVGLGNENITADSLGPKVIDNIDVTRHILEYAPEEIEPNSIAVSAIAPGVMGMTGIESSEIIKGIVDKIKPDALIAIDALAARRVERINKTVQISNSGIHPGSGVGNRRKGLTQQTVGIPVIAIGIPTVVETAVLVNDSLELFIDKLQKENKSNQTLNELRQMENYEKIRDSLISTEYNLIVTPKEIDDLIENMKDMVARGINLAF
ncbi:MAG: GPR endopeptidase [Clostridiales bacterium]|nr:GPR endopeptidase [Clostridiales bacterium]